MRKAVSERLFSAAMACRIKSAGKLSIGTRRPDYLRIGGW
jgi:hypothetical protein